MFTLDDCVLVRAKLCTNQFPAKLTEVFGELEV